MTKTTIDLDTRRVGLFIGDHSASEAKPHRPSRSSKWSLERIRRAMRARIHAKTTDRNNATTSATSPGKRFANFVRKRVVESIKACLTCCHINSSDTTHKN